MIILLITVMTVLASSIYSQADTAAAKTNTELAGNLYLQKAKTQKTVAWIMLGGGALLTTIGIATYPRNYDIIFGTNSPGEDARASTSAGLVVVGGLSMLGSIPIFIAAGKNKFRAKLTMASQKTAFGVPGNVSKKIPGITLSIPIGR